MRFMSCFFFVLGQTPALVLTPTNLCLHLVVLIKFREDEAKLHLGYFVVGQRGQNTICIVLSFDTAWTRI